MLERPVDAEREDVWDLVRVVTEMPGLEEGDPELLDDVLLPLILVLVVVEVKGRK